MSWSSRSEAKLSSFVVLPLVLRYRQRHVINEGVQNGGRIKLQASTESFNSGRRERGFEPCHAILITVLGIDVTSQMMV